MGSKKVLFTSLFCCVLMILALSGCSGEISQPVESLRSTPQSIEASSTTQGEETITPTQPAVVSQQAAPTTPVPQLFVDPEYYEGIIVITQYYTFLGHGLHEEALQLLSEQALKHTVKQSDYLEMFRSSFKTVEIVSIEPFFLHVNHKFRTPTPEPVGRKMFVVQIRAWGEGNMSGSVINGALQTLFIEVVFEEGAWKIDSFATAPVNR